MGTTTSIRDKVLQSLLGGPGPVCSVYLRLEPRPQQVEDARLRWQRLARQLADEGADAGAVEALARRVDAELPGSGTLVAFAAGGEVRYAAVLPAGHRGATADADFAAYGPLPHLQPLLTWRQDHPAHVLAVVDRTGADLEAYPLGGTEPIRRTVTGPDDEIERNAPGGMSQGRFQRRAEDSWEHNAVRVAETLTGVVSRVSARLVLLAGDVRAVQYLTKHLPERVRQQVSLRRVSGGRAPDGSDRVRSEQVEEETRRAGEELTSGLLRRFAEERGPGGRAVEGVHPTLRALADGRVETLVVVDDPGDRRTAWFGAAPGEVSERRPAPSVNGAPMARAPLSDVAIRTALLSGSDVRVLRPDADGAPAHGIGALCRV
ncbi:Vms1/Ankzf1 family peptidyl-tRNA hydrolase [Streptomyces sp. HNM0663]|uniref:Vms1/Ankzf1 family peptidyl-tRNA hydrolase n=1 Tax=Streptomyces chengmaiensis TaxID=3040919 RepID=A0ABT6HGU5_9ACTN|nr:Vms1/Ankzf1 family peptidyl-tRNA hydrolase [Streptomyces chengmaiensis]MDH2387908.1 Vms1/Ankzf1 family peptidyl-tRNA hydrolase [Streptomyces chengmaiensis]